MQCIDLHSYTATIVVVVSSAQEVKPHSKLALVGVPIRVLCCAKAIYVRDLIKMGVALIKLA